LNAWPTAELKELSPAPRPTDLRLRPATTADAPLLRRGYGREMMRQAVALCFSDPTVHTILVDPLASNTAFGTSRGGGDAAMPPP
jgi:hypothetical protein